MILAFLEIIISFLITPIGTILIIASLLLAFGLHLMFPSIPTEILVGTVIAMWVFGALIADSLDKKGKS